MGSTFVNTTTSTSISKRQLHNLSHEIIAATGTYFNLVDSIVSFDLWRPAVCKTFTIRK